MALARVRGDLAQVRDREEPAVRSGLVARGLVAGVPDLRLDAPGRDLGELRARRHLETPALVVGQVQMDHVEPVHPGPVDHLEHEVLGLEVPRDVEHDAAPAQARLVGDGHERHDRRGGGGLAEGVGRQELAEGGDAAGDAGGVRGDEVEALGGDVESVGLGGGGEVVGAVAFEGETQDAALGSVLCGGFGDDEAQAGAAVDEVGQEPGEGAQLGVRGDGAEGGEVEVAVCGGELLRLRDQRDAALHVRGLLCRLCRVRLARCHGGGARAGPSGGGRGRRNDPTELVQFIYNIGPRRGRPVRRAFSLTVPADRGARHHTASVHRGLRGRASADHRQLLGPVDVRAVPLLVDQKRRGLRIEDRTRSAQRDRRIEPAPGRRRLVTRE